MKNVRMRWKDARQPGIPTNVAWTSREWRRYQARQERLNEKRRAKQNRQEYKESVNMEIQFSVAHLFIVGAVVSALISAFGWPLGITFILAASVVLFCLLTIFGGNE